MPPVIPPPPDHTLVAATVKTKLPFRVELTTLTPLAGDASNRRYFRLSLAGGPPHTLVLMRLASPEAFKLSEEAVSGAAPPVTELPFVNILSHLAKADVPVPALYYYDQPAGLLYLEDVGDVNLAQASQEATSPDTPELYRHAVDLLVRLHLKATFPADPACLAFGRAFDVPLLMWEFDHFIEYGIEKRAGKRLQGEERPALRHELRKIAEAMAARSEERR